jgi:hypothetical protein
MAETGSEVVSCVDSTCQYGKTGDECKNDDECVTNLCLDHKCAQTTEYYYMPRSEDPDGGGSTAYGPGSGYSRVSNLPTSFGSNSSCAQGWAATSFCASGSKASCDADQPADSTTNRAANGAALWPYFLVCAVEFSGDYSDQVHVPHNSSSTFASCPFNYIVTA